MREKNRNSIASIEKFPQFTTMNVIDGQAGQIICASLIFYSLTIDNILNIIVLLILAGISISMLSGDNSILQKATTAKENTENAQIVERVQLAYTAALADGHGKLTETNLRTELTNEFGNNYDLGENTTTNEWVISVSQIERLRVSKESTTPTNAFGPQSDGSFIGLKSMGKMPAEYSPSGIDNSQTGNPTADGTGYKFESGHFVYAEDYEYYDYDTASFITGNVYLCWDNEDGTINDADTRKSTFGEWDVFSASGTWLGTEGLRRLLNI